VVLISKTVKFNKKNVMVSHCEFHNKVKVNNKLKQCCFAQSLCK
jgi:hypothetical protein